MRRDLLRDLNGLLAHGQAMALANGHEVALVLSRLAVVAFGGLEFGDIVGIAVEAKQLQLEPLATVALEALDRFTLQPKQKETAKHGKAVGTN